MIRKTYIHHDGALGDLLLSLPVIASLRKKTGFVHLAGGSDGVELLLEAGMIDEGSSAGSARYVSLYGDAPSPGLRAFLSGFHCAAVLTTRLDSALVRNVASIVADTRPILAIPTQGTLQHVTGFRLGQLPDNAAPVPAGINLPYGRMEQARKYLCGAGHDFSRPLISVHPGSGGSRKRWPMGSYLALLEILRHWRDPFILLLSGPAEDESMTTVLQAYAHNHPGRTAHLSKAGLAMVSALLSMSDLHIGNDSGISHLAASSGARTLALFGPTDPVLWKPIGENVRVVQSGMQCAPCGDENSRGCRERKCLSSVSPDSVFAAVRQIIH